MLKDYPVYKNGDADKTFNSLPISEQELLNEFLLYKSTLAKKNRVSDCRRILIQFRQIIEKPLTDLEAIDITGFLSVLNQCYLKPSTKNAVKADVQAFLKRTYKDWSIRFDGLEDIKFSTKGLRNTRINSQSRLNREDVIKLVDGINDDLFMKTFVLVQSEAGLRTQETRLLKWTDITFNVSGDISELRINATKTETERYPQVHNATGFLKILKKGSRSPYVFPAIKNSNKPIDKSYISVHLRTLSKTILGREIFAYMFRHETSTRLIAKVLAGKLPAPTYEKFMGHSFKQGLKSYNQLTQEEDKEIFKKNMFELDIEELPKKEKERLEKRIEELELFQSNTLQEVAQMKTMIKQFIEKNSV